MPTSATPNTPKTVPVVCRKLWLTAGLAFTAGYTDVICIARYGCFAAMQTGNLIYTSLALTSNGATGLYHLVPIAANFAGVVLLGGWVVRKPWLIAPLGAPLLLASFLACDALTWAGYGGGLGGKLLVCFPALAMGAQNTLTKEGELGLMTTLLTGNLQRVGISVSMVLHGDEIDWDEVCSSGALARAPDPLGAARAARATPAFLLTRRRPATAPTPARDLAPALTFPPPPPPPRRSAQVLTVVTCLTVIFSTLLGAIIGASASFFLGAWALVPAGAIQLFCVVGYANAYAPACLPCARTGISGAAAETRGVASGNTQPLLAAGPPAVATAVV